jgi:hypothetical protein
MPLPAQLTSNLMQLQLEQSQNGAEVRALVRARRSEELGLSMDALDGNRRAAGLRSEANNIRAGFNAAAAAVGAVGTCCSAIPYVGPIIAAICAAVAAVLTAIGNIWAQTKEDEAANVERQAGVTELEADQVGNLIEDLREDNEARSEYVDQMRERMTDLIREERQAPRW